MQKEIEKFWQLQKIANLSNAQAAEWIGVKERQISRWRNEYEAPKAVLIALRYRIRYGELNEEHDQCQQNNNTQPSTL